MKEKKEKASLEALTKPLKYANQSLPPNEDVDMVIDESTSLLPYQEIKESELSTLHKQILSSYHTELNNRNKEIYELWKKVQKSREICSISVHFSVSKIQMLRILIFFVVLKLIHSNRF